MENLGYWGSRSKTKNNFGDNVFVIVTELKANDDVVCPIIVHSKTFTPPTTNFAIAPPETPISLRSSL